MKKKITIHDIAKTLNITASTVSRALNNHPKISESTKQLVKAKAKELGYKPNTIAWSLRTGKIKTIGLVVPRINRNFISNAIAGIEKEINQHGYQLIISQSEESYEKELLAIKTLVNSQVAGIIISISAETNQSDHLKAIINENIPIVQFDRVRRDVNTHLIVNDNFNIAYKITTHLIEQGAKQIVHFAGPTIINIYQERFEGYRAALLDYRLKFDENLVFEPIITQDAGYNKMKEMITSHHIPDAIVAASDYSALGALQAFKEMNIKVPDNILITGFANEPFTKLITPSLTTIDQHAIEMGITAAKVLIQLIENKISTSSMKEIKIPCSLIIRETSTR